MRNEQIDLLALCRIKGVSWYLIAREARRPGGIQRLVHGEFTEHTTETIAARAAIRAIAKHLDELRDEARQS